MWTTKQVTDWVKTITGLPPRFQILYGPYVPPSPDAIVVITRTTGPGFGTEMATDVGGFQVRVRSSQGYNPDGEAMADALDRAICAVDSPRWISGVRVVKINRAGGPPALLTGDPDQAERLTWTCNYLPMIAS